MSAKHDQLIFELCNDQNYQINENGVIKTLIQSNGQKGSIWRTGGFYCQSRGYFFISYKGVDLRIHRIIWAKFKGYLHVDLQINHIDGNRAHNHISNLELVTHQDNQKHATKMPWYKPCRGAAKHSWETIDKIRKDRANGMSLKQLVEKYGIPKSTLSYICRGQTYREELRHG